MRSFDKIMKWSIGNNVKDDVVKMMDHRAVHENEELQTKSKNGISIKDIHKESVLRGEKYKQIIYAIIRAMGVPEDSVCADLGSGTGTCAALVSQLPNVKNVYAVEVSEQSVVQVMPAVFDYFKASKEKIIKVVGDFNRLELEDSSLDFAIEMGSFHHSEDIARTIAECYRVLKPGGFLLSIERARPNFTTEAKKIKLLDKQLSNQMKSKYGIPQQNNYTRRMWGEHEYTYRDWDKLFRNGGFTNKMVLVNSFFKWPPFRFILKKTCSVEPSAFESYYPYFRNDTPLPISIIYDLLTMPIFICIK